MKNKRKRKTVKQSFFTSKRLVVIIASIIASLITTLVEANKPLTLTQKVKLLGLGTNVNDVAIRHVEITEQNPSAQADSNYIPVHILYRATDTNEWRFLGTGTLIKKSPGWLLTAHHVMDDEKKVSLGEYGYRLIGTNEFTGHERIVPVVSFVDSPKQDDSVMCHFDINRTNYPMIDVPAWTNVFRFEKLENPFADVMLKVDPYPAHIHLFTRPGQTFDGVFLVHIRSDLSYIFFKYDPMPGESGTGGLVDEETQSNAVIVVTMRSQVPPRGMPDKFLRSIDWSPDRYYGVAIMVGLN